MAEGMHTASGAVVGLLLERGWRQGPEAHAATGVVRRSSPVTCVAAVGHDPL